MPRRTSSPDRSFHARRVAEIKEEMRRAYRRHLWSRGVGLLVIAILLATLLASWANRASAAEYKRPGGWTDADGDCINTRHEVLLAESLTPARLEGCRIVGGVWQDPYTGEFFYDPSELDVDHLVPLRHAWGTGASEWPRWLFRLYANELENPDHLVAVSARANRAKGARGPDEWVPPLPSSRCWYARAWRRVKKRWQLSSSPEELAMLRLLEGTCSKAK